MFIKENVSFENQTKIYNYGSIFDGRIDELLLNSRARIVIPQKFDEENKKLIIKFINNEK